MLKDFLQLEWHVLGGTDNSDKIVRRQVALGAALQLAEASLAGNAGSYVADNLEKFVKSIESLLDLSEETPKKG